MVLRRQLTGHVATWQGLLGTYMAETARAHTLPCPVGAGYGRGWARASARGARSIGRVGGTSDAHSQISTKAFLSCSLYR